MNVDALKIIGVIGSVLILGLVLKDYQGFNTDVGSVTNLIGQLEKAG